MIQSKGDGIARLGMICNTKCTKCGELKTVYKTPTGTDSICIVCGWDVLLDYNKFKDQEKQPAQEPPKDRKSVV